VEKDIYNFTAKSINGEDISLSNYRGKVLLIVNTASKCGFTSQYAGLQELYDKYKDKEFTILGFPCNQFGSQEPGDEKSIETFCQINYGVTFPMFAKIAVNGKNAHPLYKYLTYAQSGLFGSNIKWNFTKFLINQNGIAIKRYASITKPKSIAKDIDILLK
jgi:glutathione peroxidase